MIDTKARRTLARRLEAVGAQTALAKTLEVQQSAVSRWLSGDRRPEAHVRAALELIFGIPQPDWLTTKEAELLERIREGVEASAA